MLGNPVTFSSREEKGKEEKRRKRKKSSLILVGNVFFSGTKRERSQRVKVSSTRELNMKLTTLQVLDGHHSITTDSSLKKYYYPRFTNKETEA